MSWIPLTWSTHTQRSVNTPNMSRNTLATEAYQSYQSGTLHHDTEQRMGRGGGPRNYNPATPRNLRARLAFHENERGCCDSVSAFFHFWVISPFFAFIRVFTHYLLPFLRKQLSLCARLPDRLCGLAMFFLFLSVVLAALLNVPDDAPSWRLELIKNSKVDFDSGNRWHLAIVHDVQGEELYLKCPDLDTEFSTWGETHSRYSPRLARAGSHTPNPTIVHDMNSISDRIKDLETEKNNLENIKSLLKDTNQQQRNLQSELTNVKASIGGVVSELRKVNDRFSALEKQVTEISNDPVRNDIIILKEALMKNVSDIEDAVDLVKTQVVKLQNGDGFNNVESGLSWNEMNEAIADYADYLILADGTGEIDWAKSVHDNSKTFTGPGLFSYLTSSQTPDIVLRRVLQAGNCWPMSGSEGYIEISLMEPIYVEKIRITHIDQRITSMVGSTLKDFSVLVLNQENDDYVSIGEFTYDINGKNTQTFHIKKDDPLNMRKVNVPVKYVRLNVNSNYGCSEFTCIYRIRVHGRKP